MNNSMPQSPDQQREIDRLQFELDRANEQIEQHTAKRLQALEEFKLKVETYLAVQEMKAKAVNVVGSSVTKWVFTLIGAIVGGLIVKYIHF